ncbi:MAG: hypothetical protein IBX69_17105 [Anaerolineales bacterium]|nr:hypothetical protein [Anaerolineales bacterium]
MSNLIIKDPNTNSLLIPSDVDKDRLSHLTRFVDWLDSSGETWHTLPDLQLYANYLLVTGIRATEAASLQIADLRQEFGGELSLHIRHGKGNKARPIPYGGMDPVLALVDKYLKAVRVPAGPVFRGFYRGYQKVRKNHLTVRSIEDIVSSYPVMIHGELTSLTPTTCGALLPG